MLHVVVGIIINAEQQVLVARRQSHQIKAGCWEFPGGKVEPGETAFAALQREFAEEIGISVTQAEAWMKFDYVYPHKHVLLDVWLIQAFEGTPTGAEGQVVGWVTAAEMTQMEFPEGNKVIIERLLEHLSPS
jgi:8-oxo-dGTP diphosphatase